MIFEFLGTFLTRSIGYFVKSCFIFFEKMHKVFKNKAQGCYTPLRYYPNPGKLSVVKYWLSSKPEILSCQSSNDLPLSSNYMLLIKCWFVLTLYRPINLIMNIYFILPYNSSLCKLLQRVKC